MTKKKLGKLTSTVGSQLFDVWQAIGDLEHAIDYGPDLDEKGSDDLRTLGNVKNLLNVAFEIYPYRIITE